jgi:serine/threonine-protein kinase ATR
MGLTGVEGTFRRTMEVVLGLLRDNKETLLGVIEPFIRDPTVAWNRSGRAQRASEGDSYGGRHATTFNDIENADAMEALTKISERLNGVYNLAHPNQEKLLRACNQRKQQHPSKGLGALKEEALLPLSVQGQVHRLISEATAEENLVQMYIGWQPWL